MMHPGGCFFAVILFVESRVIPSVTANDAVNG